MKTLVKNVKGFVQGAKAVVKNAGQVLKGNTQVIRRAWEGNRGGLGAIGGGLIMLLIVAYVAYENRDNISTFFSNLWTYVETKIKTIFS